VRLGAECTLWLEERERGGGEGEMRFGGVHGEWLQRLPASRLECTSPARLTQRAHETDVRLGQVLGDVL